MDKTCKSYKHKNNTNTYQLSMTFGRYDHNHLNNTFHCCRNLHHPCILRHKFLPYLFQPRDSFRHALLQYKLPAIIHVLISYYTNEKVVDTL